MHFIFLFFGGGYIGKCLCFLRVKSFTCKFWSPTAQFSSNCDPTRQWPTGMAHLTFHSSCRPTFQAENPRIFLYEAIFWQKLSWPQLGIKSVTETLKLFEIPHEDRKFMINKYQDYAKKSPIAKKKSCKNGHGVPGGCCGLQGLGSSCWMPPWRDHLGRKGFCVLSLPCRCTYLAPAPYLCWHDHLFRSINCQIFL